MYEKDGIIYASQAIEEIKIVSVRPLDDLMMLIGFSTGETRLFDASILLVGPAFEPLKNNAIFNDPKIESGVCTWDNGAIDVAPEFMYAHSYEYEKIA